MVRVMRRASNGRHGMLQKGWLNMSGVKDGKLPGCSLLEPSMTIRICAAISETAEDSTGETKLRSPFDIAWAELHSCVGCEEGMYISGEPLRRAFIGRTCLFGRPLLWPRKNSTSSSSSSLTSSIPMSPSASIAGSVIGKSWRRTPSSADGSSSHSSRPRLRWKAWQDVVEDITRDGEVRASMMASLAVLNICGAGMVPDGEAEEECV